MEPAKSCLATSRGIFLTIRLLLLHLEACQVPRGACAVWFRSNLTRDAPTVNALPDIGSLDLLSNDSSLEYQLSSTSLIMAGTAAAQVATTIETVLGLVKRAALEPTLTGPLLYVLTRGPEKLRQPLKDFVLRLFGTDNPTQNLIRVAYIVKTLKWLFAIGLASRVNDLLTAWALNHWRVRKQGVNWDFDESRKTEIALVTGGCSGFGYLTVKGLASKMRVVVLDVSDLPEDLKGCMWIDPRHHCPS